ncbi:MAG: hypothetical protein JWN74_1998 [Acidobacteriaceae bacterium]|nr:hypothetical protein [Acidobacteriaceae bacterium]
MSKEYKLTIQAAGDTPEEAVEHAVRMLNLGASFDQITDLDDMSALEGRAAPTSEQP